MPHGNVPVVMTMNGEDNQTKKCRDFPPGHFKKQVTTQKIQQVQG